MVTIKYGHKYYKWGQEIEANTFERLFDNYLGQTIKNIK